MVHHTMVLRFVAYCPIFWSRCMMDHIEEWFFTQLGGIQNTGTAYDTFTIAPFIPDDLNHCDISSRCAYGKIRSSWQRSDDDIAYSFTIPAGTTATIIVPVSEGKWLTEDGNGIASGVNGIQSLEYIDGKAKVVVGGGTYHFTTGTIPTSITSLPIENDVQGLTSVYDLSGRLVMQDTSFSPDINLQEGVYIVNGKKMVLK